MARVSAEQRIRTALTGAAPLVALVSDRIYPIAAPQGSALPRVIYGRAGGGRETGLSGETGWEHPRIQADAEGSDYASAKAVAGAVLDAMDDATSFASDAGDQVEGVNEETGIWSVTMIFDVLNEEE